MQYVQLAFMGVPVCRCLMDVRAAQSGHSHTPGKKQHWYKIHSVEQHPPPDLTWLMVCEFDLADGVCLTKSSQHPLLAGAQTCYQNCWRVSFGNETHEQQGSGGIK